MDFASEHVFQPPTEDDAFEVVDESEISAKWSTSSPVALIQPSVAAAGTDVAAPPSASASEESASVVADGYGEPGLDATVALTTLQDHDYAGFAKKISVDASATSVSAEPPKSRNPFRSSWRRKSESVPRKPSAEPDEDASALPAAPPPPPAPSRQKLNLKYMKKRASTAPHKHASIPPRSLRQEVDTNIVSIKLGTLVQDASVHTGECFLCSSCNAALSHYSKLTLGSDGNRSWVCEFCGAESKDIDMDDEEIPTTETVDYIIKPAPEVVASDSTNNVIFCVDTSGSMCVSTAVDSRHKFRGSRTAALARELAGFSDDGSSQRMPNEARGVVYVSRLQAVQAAVDTQLTRLTAEHPNARCGLVTFNSDVALVGDGSKPMATLAGDALSSAEAVLSATRAHDDLMTQPVKSAAERLSEKVFALEEGGQTALGPAVYASVELASSAPGSRVIICTDGLANIGCGSLEDETEIESARLFYGNLAKYSQERGVSISIVTIDGTEADLDSLEPLCDRTGGDVEIVKPTELAENFAAMLSEPIIASKVEVTMKLHKDLCFRHEDASLSSITKQIGNANKDTEVMFEYRVANPKLEVDRLPFQVQIKYTASNGMEALRVISKLKPVTKSRQEAQKSMNVAICAARATQRSSELASAGQISEARLNSRAWRHTMANYVCSTESSAVDQRQYANFMQANEGMEDSYTVPTSRGRRSDTSSRWQFKGKKAASSKFM